MKKIVMALVLMPLMALAYETEIVDGITWKYTINDGTATVGAGSYSSAISSSTTGAITIPSALGGCPVTSIGDYAFYYCSGLTSVTIPEGVTSIGERSFYYCYRMTSVTIPEGVTSIGEYAFEHCSGLTSVTIPSSVSCIGGFAFRGCSGLTAFMVDSGNMSYLSVDGLLLSKDRANLLVCPEGKIGVVTIPSSVMSIGDHAFSGCSRLTSVTIPEGVTSIGDFAFENCSGLTTVTIPSSVTNIGEYAFYDCSGFESVTIPEGVTSIGSSAFWGCSGLTSVTIPSSVTSIGNSAFRGCSGLTSVTIPSSVTSIGDSAFGDCSGLASVAIPSSVTSIGRGAFSECSGLTSVTIPSSVKNISFRAFEGCASLFVVYVDVGDADRVRALLEYSIFNCEDVDFVEIEPPFIEGGVVMNSIVYLGLKGATNPNPAWFTTNDLPLVLAPAVREGWSFLGWSQDGVIPDGTVTNVMFRAMWAPTWERMPDGGPYKEVVNGLEWTYTVSNGKAELYGKVESYGYEYWQANFYPTISQSTVGAIAIPPMLGGCPVTSIGRYAFVFCRELTSVTIPEGVTSIEGGAFHGCSKLTLIDAPSSVISIGFEAFIGCGGTVVFVENADEEREEEIFGAAVLVDKLPDGGPYAKIVNGVEWKFTVCDGEATIGSGEYSIEYSIPAIPSSTSGAITIPSAFGGCPVTKIAGYALMNCCNLTSVMIPDSVTNISEGVFYGCSGLAFVKIPSSVTSIGRGAFSGCSGLKSVTIPSSVTSIGSSAFYGCSGLKSVTIPSSVTIIGGSAFYGCSGLKSVTIPSSVTSIGDYAFSGCSGLTAFMVDSGNMSYSSVDGLLLSKDRTKLLVCPEGKVGVVTIPSSVTSIGNWAFGDCSELTSVTIPSSVTSIGDSAFEYCSGLTSVTISSSVTSIGGYAFYGCPADCEFVVAKGDAERVLSLLKSSYSGREYRVVECKSLEDILPGFVWDAEDEESERIVLCEDEFPASGRAVRLSGVDDSETWVEKVVTNDVRVSFAWKASCEAPMLDDKDELCFFDRLEFCVDGEAVDAIAGEEGWSVRAFDIWGEGEHRLRWAYVKDESDSEGDDCGWLADIEVEPYQCVRFTAGDDVSGDLPEPLKGLVDDEMTIPTSELAWPRHRFVGWSDGQAVYAPGEAVLMPEGGLELVAVWEEKHLAAPTVTVPAVFTNDSVVVTISADDGASIYYTANGTDPTIESTLYTGPFIVTDDCEIRAVAVRDDWFDSEIAQSKTEKATFVVEFDAGSNGLIASGSTRQVVKFGDGAIAPNVQADEWHVFVGWDCSFDRVTGDLDVKAEYRLKARDVLEIDSYTEMGMTTSDDGVGVYLDGSASDGYSIQMSMAESWIEIPVSEYCRVWFDLDDMVELSCLVDGESCDVVEQSGRAYIETKGFGSHTVRWVGRAKLADFSVATAAVLSFSGVGGESGVAPESIPLYDDESVFLPDAGTLTLPKHCFVGWRDGASVLLPGSIYGGSRETKTLVTVWEEKHLAAPEILVPDFIEQGEAVVTISAEAGATVRYTLDGTDPDEASSVYTEPFTVDETCTIKAVAVREDFFDSEIATKEVVRLPYTFGEYLGMPDQEFTTSGDADWSRVQKDGRYALRSGAIGDSQTSALSMVVSGSGTLNFVYSVSSEAKKGIIADGLALYVDDCPDKLMWDGGVTDWKEVDFDIVGDGEHVVRWVYSKNGQNSANEDCAWIDEVRWTPVEDDAEIVVDDADGFIVLPDGKDVSEVAIKVIKNGYDIFPYLKLPAAVNGVIDLSKAGVKVEIVQETLEIENGAVVSLDSANPVLTTVPTRPGLTYTLFEGSSLEGMRPGASKVGDGQPWTPDISVKGGTSAFYSIHVGK